MASTSLQPLIEDPQVFYKILPNGALGLEGERMACVFNRKLPDGSAVRGGINRNGDVFGSRTTRSGEEHQIVWLGQLGVEALSDPPVADAPVNPEAEEKMRTAMQQRIADARSRLGGVPPAPAPTPNPPRSEVPSALNDAVREVLQLAQEVSTENDQLRQRIAELERELSLQNLELP